MKDLNITLIQTSLHWENIDKNLEMFEQKISSIQEATDLIILPEMFLTGFTMNAASSAEDMNGKAVQWMRKTAKEKNCPIVGSLVIKETGHFYNRLVWMFPDGNYKTYDKRHLFRMAEEQQTYTAGNEKIIVELNGWKICPLICYDLRFPVWSRNQASMQYDALIYVANWPERRSYPWKQLLIARAIENQCYVIGVNRIGNDGNSVYHSGDSMVLNLKGEIISKTKPHEESIETVSLSFSALEEYRKIFPVALDGDKFSIEK